MERNKRENEEIEKERENGERMRKWKENKGVEREKEKMERK